MTCGKSISTKAELLKMMLLSSLFLSKRNENHVIFHALIIELWAILDWPFDSKIHEACLWPRWGRSYQGALEDGSVCKLVKIRIRMCRMCDGKLWSVDVIADGKFSSQRDLCKVARASFRLCKAINPCIMEDLNFCSIATVCEEAEYWLGQ